MAAEYARLTGRELRRFLQPAVEPLSLKPSEYFQRNFFIGASLFLLSDAVQRYEIGVDKIMWGADYPHSEGTFPYSREPISHTFADVPPVEVRAMLGTTAGKVFGFDMELLRLVADRIGPTVADVRTRPARLPKVPIGSMSPAPDADVACRRPGSREAGRTGGQACAGETHVPALASSP